MPGLRGNLLSPAFSIIEQRTTVVERSLFTATPSRNKELLLMFGVIADALLDQTVPMSWDTQSAMTKTNAARTITDKACAKRSRGLRQKAWNRSCAGITVVSSPSAAIRTAGGIEMWHSLTLARLCPSHGQT